MQRVYETAKGNPGRRVYKTRGKIPFSTEEIRHRLWVRENSYRKQ